MKQKTKKILLFSLGLAGAGVILMGAGMLIGGIPGVRISKNGVSSPPREKQYIMEDTIMGNQETIHDIDIDLDSDAEVIFRPSEDNAYHAEYILGASGEKPVCEVTDHVLCIRQEHTSSLIALDLSSLFGKDKKKQLIVSIPEKNALNTVSICHHGTFQMSEIHWCWLNELHLKNDQMDLTMTSIGSGNDGSVHNCPFLVMESDKLSIGNMHADTFLLTAEYSDCEFTQLHCTEETSFELDSCDMALADVSFSGTLKLENSDSTTHISRFRFGNTIFTLDNASLDLIGGTISKLDCQISYGNLNLTLPDASSRYNFDMQTRYGTITFPGMEDQITSVDTDTQACQIKDVKRGMGSIRIQGDDADINITEGGEYGPRDSAANPDLSDYYFSNEAWRLYEEMSDYFFSDDDLEIEQELSDYLNSHHSEPDGHHEDGHH